MMMLRLLLVCVLLQGCSPGAHQVPSKPTAEKVATSSVSPTPSPGPETKPERLSENPDLKRRYSELLEAGKPEQVLKEFSNEELVRSAGVLFDHHVSHGSLYLYSTDRSKKGTVGTFSKRWKRVFKPRRSIRGVLTRLSSVTTAGKRSFS